MEGTSFGVIEALGSLRDFKEGSIGALRSPSDSSTCMVRLAVNLVRDNGVAMSIMSAARLVNNAWLASPSAGLANNLASPYAGLASNLVQDHCVAMGIMSTL